MADAAPHPLLDVEDLNRHFPIRGFMGRRTGVIRAVDGVTITVNRGEILGIVGETGCGKSTLGKTIAGLHEPTSGMIRLAGTQIALPGQTPVKTTRAQLQYVYQDPGASLDPQWTIASALHEPLIIHTNWSRDQRMVKIGEMIAALGLPQTILDFHPHEVSGGQLRRVGLARVLLLNPALVIFDEPTAGLDASIKATVLALLNDLRQTFDLTYILMTHDINVARSTCDRIAVMYLGQIVEIGPAEQLVAAPRHPYTRSLMAALPRIGGPRVTESFSLRGELPSPSDLPSGCRFRTRCPAAIRACAEEQPNLEYDSGHAVACLRWRDMTMS